MNRKKVVVVAAAAAAMAYVYNTGGDELLKQLTQPPDATDPTAPDEEYEDYPEQMPWWQLSLIGLAASIGFDALGMAAKRAYAATQKKVAAKVAAEASEKAAAKAATEVGEKVGAKVVTEVGEKVGAKVATEVGEDVVKALVKLEAEGVQAATTGATKAAVSVVDDVTKVAVTKAGTEVAEKVAAKAGTEIAEKVAAKAATAAAEKAAAKAATVAARAAATATKIASMTAKATAMGPLGVADLLIAGIVITLQSTVKELDPYFYEPIPAGLWSYDQLPDAAKVTISSIPIAGSLLDLVGPLFQFGEKCPAGTHQESPGGLCFPDCPAGYKSDGAFLCYKQYDGFDQNGGNGQLHTLTSITKNILLDTGIVPTDCGPDRDNDAGLCYPKCKPGFHGVGPLCWQDTVTLGAGTAVGLEDCPAGYRNDGLTCFKDAQCSGGGCRTYECGRLRGAFGEDWGPSYCTSCDPIKCEGPWTVGRLDNGGTCPDGKERIDGLCYDRCPDGFYHTPGMPYLCKRNNEPDSYDRGGSVLPSCGGDKGENISGLCYGRAPEGYTRKVVGTLDQNCPAGSSDFGVGCTRESTTRDGTLALVAELRTLLKEE